MSIKKTLFLLALSLTSAVAYADNCQGTIPQGTLPISDQNQVSELGRNDIQEMVSYCRSKCGSDDTCFYRCVKNY